jgi:hypothetical protein
VTLTRREFLEASGGALALTAVAIAWPPARAGAAPERGAEASRAPTEPAAGAAAGIERQRRFRDGVMRPCGWTRGGSTRVVLRDPEHVELFTSHRGRALLRLSDSRARAAIACELSPGVLHEVLAEAARQRANGV